MFVCMVVLMNNLGFRLTPGRVWDLERFNPVTEAVLDPNYDIVELVFSQPDLEESHPQRERGA